MLKLQEDQFDPYIEEVNMLPIVKILEPTDSLKWKTTRFPCTESTFVYEYFNFKVLNSGSGNSHEKVPILIVTNSNIACKILTDSDIIAHQIVTNSDIIANQIVTNTRILFYKKPSYKKVRLKKSEK